MNQLAWPYLTADLCSLRKVNRLRLRSIPALPLNELQLASHIGGFSDFFPRAVLLMGKWIFQHPLLHIC